MAKPRLIIIEETTNGCLECVSHLKRAGYTMINYNNKMRQLTTILWEHCRGPIPEGMELLHSCDNPACVNLDHLSVGTHKQNMNECVARGRTAKGTKIATNKLSEKEVIDLLQLKDTMSTREAAVKYNVSHTTVRKIWNGQLWNHLTKVKI